MIITYRDPTLRRFSGAGTEAADVSRVGTAPSDRFVRMPGSGVDRLSPGSQVPGSKPSGISE